GSTFTRESHCRGLHPRGLRSVHGGELPYRDASLLGDRHHVFRTPARGQVVVECDNEIGAELQHLHIADWTSSPTVLVPLCRVLLDLDLHPTRARAGDQVGATIDAGAVNDYKFVLVHELQPSDNRQDRYKVHPVTVAADDYSHYRSFLNAITSSPWTRALPFWPRRI